jgi:hypothetical protein
MYTDIRICYYTIENSVKSPSEYACCLGITGVYYENIPSYKYAI